MADQSETPADVTPKQFFEELMPAGYRMQQESGIAPPRDLRVQYHLEGDGGGTWHVHMAGADITVNAGEGDAHIAVRLSVDHFAEALHGRNGADLVLVVPQGKPGRPDASDRVKLLKGTVEMELSRAGAPFRTRATFGGADRPRTILKAKIEDYVGIQQGRLNAQEAFMMGKVRIEGDMAFMMQVAMLQA